MYEHVECCIYSWKQSTCFAGLYVLYGMFCDYQYMCVMLLVSPTFANFSFAAVTNQCIAGSFHLYPLLA